MNLADKITRLENGEPPRVLDLFSGCGGFALGFAAAGFAIVGGLEKNPDAAATHAHNLVAPASTESHHRHAKSRDIEEVEPEAVLQELCENGIADAVDVVIAGPPCQVYARVGRAKHAAVSGRNAHLSDRRGTLYERLLDYVHVLKPLAVVVENVPDMLFYGGINVAEEICCSLEGLGYNARYTLLNAVHYGVPQHRQRIFIIALAQELCVLPQFPRPSHLADPPSGYVNPFSLAKKLEQDSTLFGTRHHFVLPPAPDGKGKRAVTAEQALSDLPSYRRHLDGLPLPSHQRFGTLVRYRNLWETPPYAKLMRRWPGFESNAGVRDHVIRHTPRDFETFRAMKPGEEYPKAQERALNRLDERLWQAWGEGVYIPTGCALYENLKKEIVPPYDASKFPNKWHKMRPNQPCRTLTAHLGKDTYSHIHYDKHQARGISVREAARLQSFPDGFTFLGGMGAAYRMIGNAVPPLVAKALAEELFATITLAIGRQQSASVLGGDGAATSSGIQHVNLP